MLKLRTNPVIPRFKALLGLPMHKMSRPLGIALALFLMLSAVSVPVHAAAESDPLECLNRTTYSFNRGIDKLFFKPLATSYKQVTPAFLQRGVRNIFKNLDDVRVSFNDVLQLDFKQASADLARVAINTTLGIGGVFDVANDSFGLRKNRQDFGMTLAHYGVGSGPYIVLPLFGPSTLRDAFGIGFDRGVDSVANLSHVATRNSLSTGKAVDFRASVLSFDDLIVGDEYLFVRGAYLQQRDFAIHGRFPEFAFEDF
ncbi:MAG: VacJ family lipoprotein [Pseudomonadales bacterium]|nr:VacJ family lipoprotein [Pseudomonadales bacterium]